MHESPNWHTSSYTKDDNCVEVADNDPKKVMVRDTKTRNPGFVVVQRASWSVFVEYAKQG